MRRAERAGALAGQLIAGRPEAMTLNYRGALLEMDPGALRAAEALVRTARTKPARERARSQVRTQRSPRGRVRRTG